MPELQPFDDVTDTEEVVTLDDMDPEDRAELLEDLDVSYAQWEAGEEGISWEELRVQLRARHP